MECVINQGPRGKKVCNQSRTEGTKKCEINQGPKGQKMCNQSRTEGTEKLPKVEPHRGCFGIDFQYRLYI